MIPNITKGEKIVGLMVYLQGPGKENEHERARVVTGHASIVARAPHGLLDRDAAMSLAHAIDEPRVVFGTRTETTNRRAARAAVESGVAAGVAVADATHEVNVWHCSLSLRPEEGELSDEKWATIAADFMKEMEFDDPDSPRSPVRWVAVRHGKSVNGGDHVHIAASVVREDGTRANTFNDYKRAQKTCNVLERRHGLEVLASREQDRGTRGVKPAEAARAHRAAAPETDRENLARTVRACATASTTEGEFVRRLRVQKILVRPRYAKDDTSTVVGYSVAKTPTASERSASRTFVWYGGGRLSKDLTLPRLRDEWDTSAQTQQAAVQEWSAARGGAPVAASGGRETLRIDPALLARASDDIGKWNAYLSTIPVADTAQWSRAAGRTAGVFSAWSARVEPTPGPLARAAQVLARSAQIPAHQRITPTPDRMHAGGAALIVMQSAIVARGGAAANALLLRQMMRTMEAFADSERAAGHAQHAQLLVQVRERELSQLHEKLVVAAAAEPTLTVQPPAEPATPAPAARPEGVSPEAWEAARVTGLSNARGGPTGTRPSQTPAASTRTADYEQEVRDRDSPQQ